MSANRPELSGQITEGSAERPLACSKSSAQSARWTLGYRLAISCASAALPASVERWRLRFGKPASVGTTFTGSRRDRV
jgi:hypothetical protein